MTLRKANPLTLLLVGLVFAAGVAVFGAINRGTVPVGSQSSDTPAHARTTDELVASLQAAVRDHPRNSGEYVLLADAYMQKVRETGDAGYYRRAEGVLAIARRIAPRDPAL
jgi:cytochrome c-type biogenesis protein CcmH/NrfG